jgi:hypothetical protein
MARVDIDSMKSVLQIARMGVQPANQEYQGTDLRQSDSNQPFVQSPTAYSKHSVSFGLKFIWEPAADLLGDTL